VQQLNIFDFKIPIMKENLLVSFSGGRTSAYMCKFLVEECSHLYHFTFVYANTGLEHEKTLKFVHNVDRFLNLNLVWLEADISLKDGVGTKYKIVDYETACRGNSLFVQLAKAYGLPNQSYPHCTRELKIAPILSYAKKNISGGFKQALGIRADEPKRIKNTDNIIYPLATMHPCTKAFVLAFWQTMPFDLDLEEKYGNCVTCFKKSNKKLLEISQENPHFFEAFRELEKYSKIKTDKDKGERKIFRGYKTASDFLKNLVCEDGSYDEGCEECGSIIPKGVKLCNN